MRDNVEETKRDAPRPVVLVVVVGGKASAINNKAAECNAELVGSHGKTTNRGRNNLGLEHGDDGQLHANVKVVEDTGRHYLRLVLRSNADGGRNKRVAAHAKHAPATAKAARDEAAKENA